MSICSQYQQVQRNRERMGTQLVDKCTCIALELILYSVNELQHH